MNRTDTRLDGGFTLVELLISIGLLGILMGALTAGLLAVFGNSESTMGRMAGSHEAQLANAYFADDVAAAGLWTAADPLHPQPATTIERDQAYQDGTYACGTATTPIAQVRMAWDDYRTAEPTRVTVSYGVRTSGPRAGELVRTECRGTADPVETVVARDVAHDVAHMPAATCFTSSGALKGDCASPDVARVDLVVKIENPDDPNPFTVTLSGQRRQA